MTESSLKRYEIDNDILVVYVSDTSPETVRDWYESSIVEMSTYDKPVKRLYDMRDLKSISIEAVRIAIKIRRYPTAHFAYTAVLTNTTTVMSLVRASLSVQANTNIRLFTDEQEAINWLNHQVPT